MVSGLRWAQPCARVGLLLWDALMLLEAGQLLEEVNISLVLGSLVFCDPCTLTFHLPPSQLRAVSIAGSTVRSCLSVDSCVIWWCALSSFRIQSNCLPFYQEFSRLIFYNAGRQVPTMVNLENVRTKVPTGGVNEVLVEHREDNIQSKVVLFREDNHRCPRTLESTSGGYDNVCLYSTCIMYMLIRTYTSLIT